jgi:hypothetical protein
MSAPVEIDVLAVPFKSDADRRRHSRHPGRAQAEIVRESDPLRHVLRVEMIDVSISGVGFLSSMALKPDERVRVRLRNVVQRFLKEVRAVVRWTMPTTDGQFRIGVEVLQPFTALEMQMLRRAGVNTPTETNRTWV